MSVLLLLLKIYGLFCIAVVSLFIICIIIAIITEKCLGSIKDQDRVQYDLEDNNK